MVINVQDDLIDVVCSECKNTFFVYPWSELNQKGICKKCDKYRDNTKGDKQ